MHPQYSDDDAEPDNVDTWSPQITLTAMVATYFAPRVSKTARERNAPTGACTVLLQLRARQRELGRRWFKTRAVRAELADIAARMPRALRAASSAIVEAHDLDGHARATAHRRLVRVTRHVTRCRVARHRAPVRSIAARTRTAAKPTSTADPEPEPPRSVRASGLSDSDNSTAGGSL